MIATAGLTRPAKAIVTAREVLERLMEAESELDLLRYELDGWCIWPLLRKPIADSLTGLATSLASGGQARSPRLLRAIGDVYSWPRIPRATLVVKTYTSGLLERASGRYKDVWVDDVLLAARSFVKLESVNSQRLEARSRQALVPRSATTTLLETVSGSVLSRLRPPRDIEKVAAEVSEAVTSRLGAYWITTHAVGTALAGFRWQRRAYEWLLRRIQPRALLVVDPSEHALVAAAKGLGITVGELQHGVTDRYHAGYSWGDYAVPYRNRMPLPDRMLLYGEHWRREFATSRFWKGDLVVVGSPRVDDYRARAALARGSGETILVTSQGIDQERVAAFIAAFLRDTAEVGTRVVVKLHPIFERDARGYISVLGDDPRVTVIAGDEDPSTFELLLNAAVHVSISSAVHYDALGLGVPSVVLPLRGHDVVMPLVAAGHARLASAPDMLAAEIAAATSSGVPTGVADYYFAKNAVANIQLALGLTS